MLHLSTDRLAALGDELPTPAESAHLAICEPCSRERSAYQTLVSMAHAEHAQLGMPLTRWDAISSALAAGAPLAATQVTSLRRTPRWPMQAAAALLLMAGGAMLGRKSAGATLIPVPAVPTTVATAPASDSARRATDSVSFASIDAARAAQQRAELRYQQAAAFLAEHDSTGADDSPVAYRSRLAALDRVISTTREAMREAPHDPVINGYYLTTIGQREATLRQMNTALPASLRLNRF